MEPKCDFFLMQSENPSRGRNCVSSHDPELELRVSTIKEEIRLEGL